MPSTNAVIAHYSLGAALSCDALRWKTCSWKGDTGSLLPALLGCFGKSRGVCRLGVVVGKEYFKRDLCSL